MVERIFNLVKLHWREIVVGVFLAYATYELITIRIEIDRVKFAVYNVERETRMMSREVDRVQRDIASLERAMSRR